VPSCSADYDRVVERRRAVALARHFREAEGLSIAQIAERLGRSPATVKADFYDPTGRAGRCAHSGIPVRDRECRNPRRCREDMEVGVRPADCGLHDLVQPVEADVRWDEQTAPDRWLGHAGAG
jgi:Homeodomain-like domain